MAGSAPLCPRADRPVRSASRGGGQGTLKTQLMQLLLLAASHPAADWMAGVAQRLGTLASLPPRGGINYVRVFVLYILATQDQRQSRRSGTCSGARRQP